MDIFDIFVLITYTYAITAYGLYLPSEIDDSIIL